MSPTLSYLLVLTTCPDEERARALAQGLVADGLCACVSVVPGVRSYYRWQGALESAEELQLLIKTRADRYPELETAIRNRHPYEVPEILAVPLHAGLAAYLAWIDDSVSPPR
ncbi:MAG: divalent-cation tolerance protein CutA [Gammaproteobacteria bacterium]|jgi:periplasmic divalent cation tolerance protein|nr:divalent-cation tolerance protein CutA [Gammaproteobacteria bacterium]